MKPKLDPIISNELDAVLCSADKIVNDGINSMLLFKWKIKNVAVILKRADVQTKILEHRHWTYVPKEQRKLNAAATLAGLRIDWHNNLAYGTCIRSFIKIRRRGKSI